MQARDGRALFTQKRPVLAVESSTVGHGASFEGGRGRPTHWCPLLGE